MLKKPKTARGRDAAALRIFLLFGLRCVKKGGLDPAGALDLNEDAVKARLGKP